MYVRFFIWCKACFVCAVLSLLQVTHVRAQSVLYSSLVSNSANAHFEVVGKVGNFYWVQKSRKVISFRKRAVQTHETDFAFEIYDARLNRINTIPYTLSDTVLKQYLIAGDQS